MRPSQLVQAIVARHALSIAVPIDRRRPIHITGAPGIGKTQIVGQAAKAMSIGFKVIHAPLMQPEDYGLPCFNTARDNVSFIVSSDKFPLEGSDCPEFGILLIDELNQVDMAGMKILANLCSAGEIHGRKLKAGWTIVTTGNRAGDRAGAVKLLGHLGARLTQIAFEPSLNDWVQWALANGIHLDVISFISFRPHLLNEYNPQLDVSPTARAWSDGVSANYGKVAPENEHEIFAGDVGEGPAAEFCGYLKIKRKLPNIDTLLLNPMTAHVPLVTEPDGSMTLYAISAALAQRCEASNFGQVMQYVMRMPGEFQTLFISLTVRCPIANKQTPACGKCKACTIAATREFINWASGAGAKLLT